ncbi:hypothetical protein [Rhizobacter sp. SG703]|uniref:hypothetical protein n=1 Tax=Rhizobacter sp. SG703 TaxID=2587140 RepID=UPI001444ED4E|nr:hypothetical protein [Rhizobacter sp. SG703]NKI96403.1 hypothetical protein [Rhizobacter sp. SG703]
MKPPSHLLKPLAPALLLAATVAATAAPDEAVVREMARQTHIPADDIRRDHDACDSGVTLSMESLTKDRADRIGAMIRS